MVGTNIKSGPGNGVRSVFRYSKSALKDLADWKKSGNGQKS